MKRERRNQIVRLNTHLFGEIEVDSKKVIDFPEGLIGFNDYKRFVILDEKKIKPFRWLQCVDEPSLAFVVVNPQVVKPDFSVNVEKDKVTKLELSDSEDALVYTIVVLAKNPKDMTTNLRGPIIVNKSKRKGMQIILDDPQYATSFNIFEEVARWVKAGESAQGAGESTEKARENLVAVE